MSLILDALQRAETERAGKTESPTEGATQLLKRVERVARELQDQDVEAAQGSVEVSDAARNGETFVSHAGFSSHPPPDAAPDVFDVMPPNPDQFPTLHPALPFNNRLVALSDKESSAAEAFRLLSVRLRHFRRDHAFKKLLIASTVTQEGKSMISVNLACTLAAASPQRVLLVEGDVRRSSVSDMLRIDSHLGLCEYLRDKRSLSDCIYRIEEAGLWFMPAGSAPTNPLELLQSAQLPAMMRQLNESFDWIIIDSPPVLPLADTSIWARLADRVLLVTRHGTTEKRKLMRGLETLDPNKLIGAVLNSSTSSSDEDYYYYRRPPQSSSSPESN